MDSKGDKEGKELSMMPSTLQTLNKYDNLLLFL